MESEIFVGVGEVGEGAIGALSDIFEFFDYVFESPFYCGFNWFELRVIAKDFVLFFLAGHICGD